MFWRNFPSSDIFDFDFRASTDVCCTGRVIKNSHRCWALSQIRPRVILTFFVILSNSDKALPSRRCCWDPVRDANLWRNSQIRNAALTSRPYETHINKLALKETFSIHGSKTNYTVCKSGRYPSCFCSFYDVLGRIYCALLTLPPYMYTFRYS